MVLQLNKISFLQAIKTDTIKTSHGSPILNKMPLY